MPLYMNHFQKVRAPQLVDEVFFVVVFWQFEGRDWSELVARALELIQAL